MNFLNTLLNRGADFAIAREERKEAALLPAAPMTPNEQVVQQTPSEAAIENGKISTAQPSPLAGLKPYLVPILVSASAIVVGGLLLRAVGGTRGKK